jgi:hypothetical protein
MANHFTRMALLLLAGGAALAAVPVVCAADGPAPAPEVRISSDDRALEVKRVSDKQPIKVPVLDQCGNPMSGPPKMTSFALLKGDLVVRYGRPRPPLVECKDTSKRNALTQQLVACYSD